MPSGKVLAVDINIPSGKVLAVDTGMPSGRVLLESVESNSRFWK